MKKLVSLFLVILLMSSTLTAYADSENDYDLDGWEPVDEAVGDLPNTNPFTDVSTSQYFYNTVLWAVDEGITTGTSATTFSPDETCTNAQIITFLWRALGKPTSDTQNPFSDIKSDDYYYEAALWAYDCKMTSGNNFYPNEQCTRSMTVLYFWILSGCPDATASGFSDVPASASYTEAVAWAVEHNITLGTSETTFSPNETCTRAQIVTFLYRYLAG